MTCPADLSTMTEADAHAACEALRTFLRIVPFTPEPAGEGADSEVIA